MEESITEKITVGNGIEETGGAVTGLVVALLHITALPLAITRHITGICRSRSLYILPSLLAFCRSKWG